MEIAKTISDMYEEMILAIVLQENGYIVLEITILICVNLYVQKDFDEDKLIVLLYDDPF